MGDKIVNCFIASIIGCISAVATVWFLSMDNTSASVKDRANGGTTRMLELEVDRIRIKDSLVLVDAQTGKTLIELRGGVARIHDSLYAGAIGAAQVTGNDFRLTRTEPWQTNSDIISHWRTNREGNPFLTLTSKSGAHDLTFGFDNRESGFILSQNKQENAIEAHAIYPLPRANGPGLQLATPVPPTKLF